MITIHAEKLHHIEFFIRYLFSVILFLFQMAPLQNEFNVPTKLATFAMACFWAPDCIFGVKKGVVSTLVGYSGGTTPDPIYHKL